MTIFSNIDKHVAIVRSLYEVVQKIAVVDDIEDNAQAEHVFIEIAKNAETARDHFEYVRAQALKGAAERRSGSPPKGQRALELSPVGE